MRERTESMIRSIADARAKRRKWLALAAALAVLTGGNVFWALRETGTALTDDALCTLETHNHSERCYDADGNLICEKQEHLHTAACLSDEAADTETPEIWERTLPPGTGLTQQERTAQIAESQLGYTESTRNFIPGEDGAGYGYTRYGAWYGNPYGEWNTLFTYFCLYYAGVSTEDLPYGGNARTWQSSLNESELIRPPDTDPGRGYVILLDSDADGEADRTGIITGTDEVLTFIEGNLEHRVAARQLSPDDAQILGYVAIPEPDTPSETAKSQPTLQYSAQSPSGILVSASAEQGAFPADAVMNVKDVSREEALQTAQAAFDSVMLDAVAVDIGFYAANGTELEPTGTVEVQIMLPESMRLPAGGYSLLHVSDEGDVQTVEAAEITESGAEFAAESFSIFVLTADGSYVDKDLLITVDGQYVANSAEHPYVAARGDSFTLKGYTTHNPNTYQGWFFDNDNSIVRQTQHSTAQESDDHWSHTAVYHAEASGTTHIRIDGGTDGFFIFYVQVVEPAGYIKMHDGSEVPLNDALIELNNSTDRVFHLLEGESVTFVVNGYNDGKVSVPDWFIENGYLSKTTYYQDGKTYTTVTALKHGTNGAFSITFNGESIGLDVKHPMYVKDNLQDRDFDRINEWLAIYAAGQKENGYHPNSIAPYLLYEGDTLTLRVPKGELANANLVIGTADAGFSIADGSLNLSGDEINVTLLAHNPTDHDVTLPIYLRDEYGNTLRTMYVTILKKNNTKLDHADIEIADGGKYTVTKLKRNSDGTYTKIVVEYDAYVTGVNSSTLYQADNTYVPMYRSKYWVDPAAGTVYYEAEERVVGNTTKWFVGDTEVQLRYESEDQLWDESVTGYQSKNYAVDPRYRPGEPQYEFTSKYRPDGNGNFLNWSNILFFPSDVDHVVFDVQLGLKPTRQTEYTKTGSEWVAGATQNITTNELVTLPSVKFTMNHQAVLDAFNKCPNHTGLDFTVMAFSALVELDLSKKLTGGEIQADQFRFEAYRQDAKGALQLSSSGGTIDKSEFRELINDYMNFRQAYRIFVGASPDTEWGEGIAGTAVLEELHAMSGYSDVHTAADVFGRVGDEAVMDVLKKHLAAPATVTDEGTVYRVPNDGWFLFTFESDPIQTVSNDANGVVTFDTLHFEKSGTYHYIIREKQPEGATDIIYDTKEIELKIKVDEVNKQLTADILSDIASLEFINHQPYILPSTGGNGSVPYYLGGTVILAAALLLFEKKRRRAASDALPPRTSTKLN